MALRRLLNLSDAQSPPLQDSDCVKIYLRGLKDVTHIRHLAGAWFQAHGFFSM